VVEQIISEKTVMIVSRAEQGVEAVSVSEISANSPA